ncbi:MAG: lipid A biosynthesis acyltransferase [Rhodoferax sp.]|uniref:LpxL/LpxP family acyltransferase n=1 Tax=Rhodoferax sp. TaxID=50421 RepID=UPI001B5900D3|nr:lipid A biosynthesis acyltransferase [Rhodoferax sp.]MBP9906844.1 lipid A biosynthesis acyltransferase [Rhodoferax sp.]
MSQMVLLVLRWLGRLPLPWLRWLGVGLGRVLFVVVVSRRKVVLTNLSLCFPNLSPVRVRELARQVFVCVAQSWLDRGWLWHGTPALLRQRLVVAGAVEELAGGDPVVLFAPHFVGLDAGWTALTQQLPRRFTTIYTDQANKTMDAWILAGRQRFGTGQLFGRADGVKAIVAALRQGDPLYLLPDMNFGPKESVFVPFYGISAATVPSLARFARLGRAKVVPVVTRLTATGYEVRLMPCWENYPTQDALADTAEMNSRLQALIDTMPEQYYWVHKRFKDRPPGDPPIYQ